MFEVEGFRRDVGISGFADAVITVGRERIRYSDDKALMRCDQRGDGNSVQTMEVQ